MSTDINVVTVLGRLGKDAELKYTATGTAILTGSIANNQGYKKDDQWTETVHWFDFKIFGKRAEGLAQYMTKGTKIAIKGILQQERWQSQDGGNRSKVVIKADDINFAGGKKQDDGGYQKPQPVAESAEVADGAPVSADGFQDDIPF